MARQSFLLLANYLSVSGKAFFAEQTSCAVLLDFSCRDSNLRVRYFAVKSSISIDQICSEVLE